MRNDDGGTAFPAHSDGIQGMPRHAGMSLRDYFAAYAIERMISLCQDGDGGWSPDNVAAGCYALADAMLAARKAGGA